MARLPNVGSDSGQWGTILNEYLNRVHASDGTIAPGAVVASALSDSSVTTDIIASGTIGEADLDPALLALINSRATLAGDVTGLYTATVVSGVNGVAVTGAPTEGHVIKATSPTAAAWQADALSAGVYVATADVTARTGDVVMADTTAGAFTVTLPPATAGAVVRVKKVEGLNDQTTVTVRPANDAATIDGQSSWQADYKGDVQTFTSDGTNWYLDLEVTARRPDDPPPPNSPSNARWAGEFLDSIGIVGSFQQVSIPDNTLLDRLNYAGAKRIRNSAAIGTAAERAATITRFNMLFENGYKWNLVLSPLGSANVTNETEIDNRINAAITFLSDNPSIAAGVTSIEYFNELNSSQHGDEETFDVNIAYGVPRLWERSAALRAAGIKILAPSIIGYKLGSPHNDAAELKTTFDAANDQPIHNYVDYGNIHAYYGTPKLPEMSFPDKLPPDLQDGWPTQFARVAPSGNSGEPVNIYRYVSWYISRQKPIIITETNHKGEPGQARGLVLIPRLLLENFRIGIKETYIFNLLLFNGYGIFGNATTDYEIRPTATAMHNLTTILADTAASYTPSGTLDYSLPTNVRRVLLQKSDGSFWLCVWRAAEYDTAASNATLTFTSNQTIQQYKDLDTTPLAAQGPNTSFTISVGPKVSIIKIT